MSRIASMPEWYKVKTPCGVLYGKSGIVGRYAEFSALTIYECLVCGRDDFESGEGLTRHVKQEHPER
jgi:hypothetical protein